MKAAVYYGPGDVRIEDVREPGPPGLNSATWIDGGGKEDRSVGINRSIHQCERCAHGWTWYDRQSISQNK